jgi:hypothetical protein
LRHDFGARIVVPYDGELIGTGGFTAKVLPKALAFVVSK